MERTRLSELEVCAWLPLKELVFYPVVQYASYTAAKRRPVLEGACVHGVLALLQDLPYECVNSRDQARGEARAARVSPNRSQIWRWRW